MFNDFATITLTDHRGHTEFQFVKEKADSLWSVASDPASLKSLQYMRYARDLPPDPIVRLPDGRERLNVPGPPLPWDAATWAALDRSARQRLRETYRRRVALRRRLSPVVSNSTSQLRIW